MNKKVTIEYSLNEPQKSTLEKMKTLARSAHFINIMFRDNGEDKFLEADFLRKIIKQL